MNDDLPKLFRSGSYLRDMSWVEKIEIERDICLFLHQQSESATIDGHLYYEEIYNRPYQDYLEIAGLELAEIEFIISGCLMLILARAWQNIDKQCVNSGGVFRAVRERVGELELKSNNLNRLKNVVSKALSAAINGDEEDSFLVNETKWVHDEFIKGYFFKKATGFNHSYFNR